MNAAISNDTREQITVKDLTANPTVRLITLSRPERLNAWTPKMQGELIAALEEGNADPKVGAFIITGEGRGFCAGADIGEVFAQNSGNSSNNSSNNSTNNSTNNDSADSAANWVNLVRQSKPIVAAINGAAIGVGLTMVLSMDYLVADSSAKLSCRFVKMGVVPELASSHFLVQRCGWGAASDLALSGRTITGAEAKAVGLVDEATDNDVVEVALERAISYAENAPAAVMFTKELLTANATETDLNAVQKRELTSLNKAYRSDDHAEAVAAFLEKREPVFGTPRS